VTGGITNDRGPGSGCEDKTIHDDVNELSLKRCNGYAWFNAKGVAVLNDFKAWAKAHPSSR
jgi:hypothetical protein